MNDQQTYNQILEKSKKMQSEVEELVKKFKQQSFGTNYQKMIISMDNFMKNIKNNLNFYTDPKIFQKDFNQSIIIINTFFDCYIKSFESFQIQKSNKHLFNRIKDDIDLFSQIFNLFFTNFEKISQKVHNSQKDTKTLDKNLNLLGLNFVLFKLSIKIEPTKQLPFYKSQFLLIFNSFDSIREFESTVAAFKSVRGSGKSVCIPLMIIYRFLEEGTKNPFLLMTEPSRKIVEEKTAFFRSNIGQYAKVTNEVSKLISLYKKKKDKQVVFGIVTPEDLLFVIQSQNQTKKTNFFNTTRILVDEAHEQSIYTDVLMTIIKSCKDAFQLPLTFSMMSATISQNQRYVQFFEDELKVTKLAGKRLFSIQKNKLVSTGLQAVIDETNKTIELMSKKKSKIEEGNLICFLPANDAIQILKGGVISYFQQNEENEEMRKVVIMKTSLKPNEPIDSYFNRLRNEYELVKGINDAEDEEVSEKSDGLYFVIVDLSDQFESANYKLAHTNFPDDLEQINKIILALSLNDSLLIDKLSVVIDSGLSKVSFFNRHVGLYASNVIQSSCQSMDHRRGLLGRTMNGFYTSFCIPKIQPPNETEASVVHDDLTQGILNLKEINIDFEKLYLPSKPNMKNIDYSLKILKEINAIDNNLNITSYGKQIIKMQRGRNSVISIYYAHAVLNFKDSFSSKIKKSAQFFGFYLALLISMAVNLVQETMAEKLTTVFSENSDVETLLNATKILLSSDLTDNDKLRDFVESYGFSYSTFLVFRSILQEEAKVIFENEEVSISTEIDSFIQSCKKKKHNTISIIDKFIQSVSSVDPKWMDMHAIDFNYIKDSRVIETRPTLAFTGNPSLSIWNQHNKKHSNDNSEIRITQRPGWNGIMIPTKCICLDICIYYNKYLCYGNIVHRFNHESKGDIISLELPKAASSHWFIVLIEAYFARERLNVKCFTYISFENNERVIKKRLFHISNTGERTFLSFIPFDDDSLSKIQNGINQCMKLMPFVPRSVLIYRAHPRAVIEVTSIGTQNYDPFMTTQSYGDKLRKEHIEYCIKHLDKLCLSQPEFRICCLFFNKECTIDDFNQKRLYFVSTKKNKSFPDMQNIITVIEKQRKSPKDMNNQKESQNIIRVITKHRDDLAYFMFPPTFIHPALLLHQETHNCIMKWLSQCKYAKVIKTVGSRFLMPLKSIRELQKRIRTQKDELKRQMGLNYVAIPIPSIVYEKAYLTIREHPNWIYNNRFKVIITTIEEEKNVNDLVKKITDENKEQNPFGDDYITDTLCCCYICDDPDNPVLTNLPITIYYQDGKTYTSKMCRDCLYLNLQNTTNSFFNEGKINQDSLDLITSKPAPIPSVDSTETEDGMQSWPQIPLGQMISVLINNDDELSQIVSAWLNSVQEFTIRNVAKENFTFCPNHPKIIFRIKNDPGAPQIKCKNPDCKDVFCNACFGWHQPDFVCEEKKTGGSFKWQKKCPKCHRLTVKSDGCNHMTCPCGCHWCYVCGEGFKTSKECYAHMKKIHGSSYTDF